MSRAASQDSRVHQARWLILTIMCLSVLLVAIDNTIVNVALPTISRDVTASTSELQWIVDAYAMVFAGLLLVAGNLGDRFGRKRVLQVGLVLFAIASLVATWSGSVGNLIASRGAMGVAAAMVYPSTLATVPQVFRNRQERAVAIGVWAGVSGLAIALGPVVGGLLLEHFWWGSIFLVNVPIAAVALVAGAILIPESKDPDPGRFDYVGAISSSAGIGLLVWTIIEAPDNGWASATTLTGFGIAAILLVLFGFWETRCTDPLLEVRFFRNPRLSAAAATTGMAFFGLFGFIFMITLYFQLILGWDALKAGLATLPYALVMGAMSPIAMIFTNKIGTKIIVGGGMALSAAGFLLASWAEVDSPYWSFIVVCMVLMAAGMGLATGPATDAVLAALPKEKSGVGSAINDTTREVGGALGVAVVGSALNSVFGHHLAQQWTALNIPHEAIEQSKGSVAVALTVAGSQPDALAARAVAEVGNAFIEGLRLGCYIVAGAILLASLAAWLFLPARDTPALPADPQTEPRSSEAP
ncbi:DHA2 family efflux MFS transporter permease subunit [Pseudactinotalea sp. HY158]|uniref:DHA2 family efflux MFS transporter permease subunit n=1 Tax=Pseudactinotalea sp. HY158 TaxID=2654547 RepID=UPI00129CA168|nr:DHA2 family efflux MFS transporter permease subunit [Pseudactinotalea sp. HY158]QGH69471.1 DHA2 family efflux MFS transporter permease subunit [Pseudactinotalea sp. HY158]